GTSTSVAWTRGCGLPWGRSRPPRQRRSASRHGEYALTRATIMSRSPLAALGAAVLVAACARMAPSAAPGPAPGAAAAGSPARDLDGAPAPPLGPAAPGAR